MGAAYGERYCGNFQSIFMNAFGETGEGSERADFDLCRRKRMVSVIGQRSGYDEAG